MSTLRIQRLTAEREDDFRAIFATSGEDARNCLCTAYHFHDWAERGREHRAGMFHNCVSDGYLLYVEGEAAGWCQCAPLAQGLRIRHEAARDPDAWGITCMVLRPAFRGRGLAHEFLREILADLLARGCRRVIAVGHRPEAYDDPKSFLELPAAVCERAGFAPERDDRVCPLYSLRFESQGDAPPG